MAVLCLTSGSGWIFDQMSPEVLHGPLRAAAHEGLLALLFSFVNVWSGRRSSARKTWRTDLQVAALGLPLFGVPLIVVTAAGGTVASLTATLMFMLSPAIVVFVAGQGSGQFGEEESGLRLLPAALAGFGGAALLLPFTGPATLTGRFWLAVIIVAVALSALASVRLYGVLAQTPLVRSVATVCGTTAVICAAFSGMGWSGLGVYSARAVVFEGLRCIFVDGPIMFLTLWLLRELKPVNAASRYLFVPLVTIVEGYAIERPSVDWTFAVGAVLLTAGAVTLLAAEAQQSARAPL